MPPTRLPMHLQTNPGEKSPVRESQDLTDVDVRVPVLSGPACPSAAARACDDIAACRWSRVVRVKSARGTSAPGGSEVS
eukprot:6271261-Prymnesium_polylepis.1